MPWETNVHAGASGLDGTRPMAEPRRWSGGCTEATVARMQGCGRSAAGGAGTAPLARRQVRPSVWEPAMGGGERREGGGSRCWGERR